MTHEATDLIDRGVQFALEHDMPVVVMFPGESSVAVVYLKSDRMSAPDVLDSCMEALMELRATNSATDTEN